MDSHHSFVTDVMPLSAVLSVGIVDTDMGYGVEKARALAAELLGGDEDRWRHTVGVAEYAGTLTVLVPPEDAEVLMVAAWLHDIGYSSILADTGLHPLDGAQFLDQQGWPARTCALVAHHSGTRYLAHARGLDDELGRHHDEQSVVSDALTYADQRVGPYGQRMSVHARLADKVSRHGPDSVQAQVRGDRDPYLLGVADRIEELLRTADDAARP